MHPAAQWLTEPGGLAERLHGLREAAHLSGERLATQLGWDRTKISKIENGRTMPTAEDITAWTAACGHPEAAAELLDMLASVRAQHRQWRHRLRQGQAAVQADWDELVRHARLIRNFEVLVIPGLMQTPAYARHVVTEITRIYGTDPARVDETVTARMRRQEALYDAGHRFEFIITEAALTFRVVPAQVMAGQLDRLLALSGLPNVTLGVIPASADVALTPLHGFIAVDGAVTLETYASDITLGDEESAAYGKIADALLAESVTGDEARELIAAAAARLREAR